MPVPIKLMSDQDLHGKRVLIREDADAESLRAAGVTQGGLLVLSLAIGAMAVRI